MEIYNESVKLSLNNEISFFSIQQTISLYVMSVYYNELY